MAKKFDYAVVVIGGGVAGVSAALTASQRLKTPKQVALITDDNFSGTSGEKQKVLNPQGIASARACGMMQELAEAQAVFKNSGAIRELFDVQKFIGNLQKQAIITQHNIKKQLLNAGVDLYFARARFLNQHEVFLDKYTKIGRENAAIGKSHASNSGPDSDSYFAPDAGIETSPSTTEPNSNPSPNSSLSSGSSPNSEHSTAKLSGTQFIIATGSTLNVGGISFAGHPRFYTPDIFFSLSPPKTICVVGAGPSGCEIAQYFAVLGSEVLLVERQDRILAREDSEISTVMTKILRQKYRIKIITGVEVTKIAENNGRKRLTLTRGGVEKAVQADEIVLATGYEPNLSCTPGNAQVSYLRRGIRVSRSLQTSTRHIWAAGGCTDVFCPPEQATFGGKLATTNAIMRGHKIPPATGFPRLIRTFPQIVSLGLSESECLEQNIRFFKTTTPLSRTLGVSTHSAHDGFAKIICDRMGFLLGASVIAPNAPEVAEEIAFALQHELSCTELVATPHFTFSFNSAVQSCAGKLARMVGG